MKIIPLTRAQWAVVDDEDYDFLMQWKWLAHQDLKTGAFYTQRRGSKADGALCGKIIHMHRVIVGCPDGMMVDHKDGDSLNNQKGNLRICTIADNNKNRRSARGSSSKYLGVERRPENNGSRWCARIRVNKVGMRLGGFATEEEAALAYNAAAIKFHGEFARLNVIQP